MIKRVSFAVFVRGRARRRDYVVVHYTDGTQRIISPGDRGFATAKRRAMRGR